MGYMGVFEDLVNKFKPFDLTIQAIEVNQLRYIFKSQPSTHQFSQVIREEQVSQSRLKYFFNGYKRLLMALVRSSEKAYKQCNLKQRSSSLLQNMDHKMFSQKDDDICIRSLVSDSKIVELVPFQPLYFWTLGLVVQIPTFLLQIMNKGQIPVLRSPISFDRKESDQPGKFKFESPRQDSFQQPKQIKDSIEKLANYALSLKRSQSKEDQNTTQLEYRDRMVSSLRQIPDDKVTDDQTLEEWIGEVCRNVASATFHNYVNENMTFEQAKIYCCQKIIRNISYFAESNKVDDKFYSTLDRLMKEQVMPYLAQKYPLNQSPDVNKTLNNMAKEINNMNELSNDLIYNSDIVWQYRENGNYNDLIMRLVNQIISLADHNSTYTQPSKSKADVFSFKQDDAVSNYKDFDSYMTQLFNKIFDPNWVKQDKKEKKNTIFKSSFIQQMVGSSQKLKQQIGQCGKDQESQKGPEKQLVKQKDRQKQEKVEKRKEKIQEYTDFRIGRKIPESILQFTDDEIKSKQLIVKSSQILRILTKWCEQLWQKFENQNYYVDRAEGLSMLQSKQINFLYQFFRKQIKDSVQNQRQNIENQMKEIEKNLYSQENQIMKSQIDSKKGCFLSRYERICGKFSIKVVNNLKNCIVVYLNRLIHGLMKVSKQFYRSSNANQKLWSSPPNLLSFKIGDILRCRISSHEKEIVRIFQEIQQISENNPQKLKIIRVKNRLKNGTNDLLINLRYNDTFTAEIQLKVKQKVSQSRFSSCSYSFSHFIYEIERSKFGPISQMCSIWNNLDSRSIIYQKLVKKQNLRSASVQMSSYCIKNQIKHQMKSIINTPFICNTCGKTYSRDNFVLPHKFCVKCKYYECSVCQVQLTPTSDLLEILIFDQKLRFGLFPQRCVRLESFPNIGVAIKIEDSSENNIKMFKKLQWIDKYYIFFAQDDNSQEFGIELKTEQQRKDFLSDNIVFNYLGQQPQCLKTLDLHKSFQQFIIPKQIEEYYNLERQKISIVMPEGVRFSSQKLGKMLEGPIESKKRIKKLYLPCQQIANLDFIPKEYSQLQFINANNSGLQNIEGLQKFTKLHSIYLEFNGISQFPSLLCSLPLRILSLTSNNLAQLPQDFSKLQQLKILRLGNNDFEKFPIVVTCLKNLAELFIPNSQFQQLPNELSDLNNLKSLDISQIDFSQSLKVLSSLKKLEVLNIKAGFEDQQSQSQRQSNYSIQEMCPIPKQAIEKIDFTNFQKLKTLELMTTQIDSIPSFKECKELEFLNLSHNRITSVNFKGILLKNIVDINLSRNHIGNISFLSGIRNISSLNLEENSLESLPQEFCQLTHLRSLNLANNRLKNIPERIDNIKSLQNLNLSQNKEMSLPPALSNMKIEILNLNECELKSFPTVLTEMKHLKVLQINSNQIKKFPEDLNQLSNLSVFCFKENKIKSLPASIIDFKRAKIVQFKQNCICLPDQFTARILSIQLSQLDMTGHQIAALPFEMSENLKVKTLILNNNKIKTIPSCIKNLKNLKLLSLEQNQIENIEEGMFDLEYLTTLNLANNKLTELPNHFDRLKMLIQLDVLDNPLTSLPDSLGSLYNSFFTLKCQKIKLSIDNSVSLDFQSKQLVVNDKIKLVLPRLYQTQKFQTIQLNNDQLEQIPSSIFSLSKVISLDLKNNNIKTIPIKIKGLVKLKILILSKNLIQEIPEELCQLTLQKFEIDNNPISKIPHNFVKFTDTTLKFPSVFQDLKKNSCFKYLTKQKNILLDNLELNEFPVELGEITSLENIDISNNFIFYLPQGIKNLQSLTSINLGGQVIENLFEHLIKLSNLTTIIANNCNLKTIPPQVGSLKNMENLILSYNCITSLPQEIGNLTVLKVLKIDNNELTTFAKNFLNPQLENVIIDFSSNQIKEIPEQFLHPSFQSINLSKNLIKQVTRSAIKIKVNYQGLNLEGNPITHISPLNYFDIQQKLSQGSELSQFSEPFMSPPDIMDKKCWKCQVVVLYPCYWLRWEDEENVFGCRKCVEGNSIIEGHHYAYESNSILLIDKWEKIWFKKMGRNIQPRDVVNFGRSQGYGCGDYTRKHSKQTPGNVKYHCLGCYQEETVTGNQMDSCEICLSLILEKDQNILEELKSKYKHEYAHPFLRILYRTRSYYDY